jgi:4-hydroxy-tetrahydrodipicolinate synthase
MDRSQFRGIIPALATPMHDDGSLNLPGVAPLIEFVLSEGVHGIFTLGSQGEAFALSADEKRQVLEAVIAAVGGRVPVIAGSGAITTRDAIALSKQAEQAGADALSIVTPYYISPSQDELYAHYAAIAEIVTIPILAYSNPMRTGGVRIAPATMARLAADFPHIIGIKDSSGDLSELGALVRACPPDFLAFVGREQLLYGALCYGAAGAVALAANVVPGLAVGVYDAFQAGDHARARAFQERFSACREVLGAVGSYPVPVKEALGLMGLPVGPARRPILPLNETQRERLAAALEANGVRLARAARQP